MENSLVISATMLRRLRNMTADEKRTLLLTLIDDELLHTDRKPLSTEMELYYLMFRQGVLRDSHRYDNALSVCGSVYATTSTQRTCVS